MNPGPAEEAGKALSTIAHAMKTQPLALGFVVTNILWITFFIWFAWTLRDRNTKERNYHKLVIERCFDLRKQLGPDMLRQSDK